MEKMPRSAGGWVAPLRPRRSARSARAAANLCAMLLAGALAVGVAHGQPANASASRAGVEDQRQQERERALREQQETGTDVRRRPGPPAPAARLAEEDESPCFRIARVKLVGERAGDFQWLLGQLSGPGGEDPPAGRCIGAKGANIVLARAQHALIERGWITTRVLAAPQDLTAGTLALTLVPGRISAIRARLGRAAVPGRTLRSALPAAPGDLLNLRDIEQGLENLQRLASVKSDIDIEPSTTPGARPGDSDLAVAYEQARPLRVTLGYDDSGTEATGRNQASATLAWDGPLGLNDLAYVSQNHDAFNHAGQGTQGYTAHYSVPWGYWLLGATATGSKYHQTVSVGEGFDDNVYRGESRNRELSLARLLHRDQRRKTSVSVGAFQRSNANFVNDSEFEDQHRRVGGWFAGLNHREYLGPAVLDANLGWRQGTGAFSAIRAAEEAWGEGNSRMRLVTADARLELPIALAAQRLRYSMLWRAQWNRTRLTPQDLFAIGGRYTVRGFDGELNLMGERGWLVRNDLGWALGATGAELYAGVDHGEVGGPSAAGQVGTSLTGAVLGLRGQWQGLAYDLFVGTPLAKPDGFRTSKVTAGFSLIYSF